nr:hypothetical protein [Segatella salivae]
MSKESQNAQLVALLHDSLLAHTSQNAFCIDDKMWTYGQLMKRVAAIRCAVRECESIILPYSLYGWKAVATCLFIRFNPCNVVMISSVR